MSQPSSIAAQPARPPSEVDKESLPTLYRDRAFWGMTITQFLGAFNDSVFKQIVLLLCAQVIVFGGSGAPNDQQWLAQGIFAVSFVLFSGIAGYIADRISKKAIIVSCKLLEVAVMVAAVAAFMHMRPRVAVEMEVSGDRMQLQFKQEKQDPTQSRPSPLSGSAAGGFFIAGQDRRFVDAQAQSNNSTLELRHPEVSRPEYLRWGSLNAEDAGKTSHRTLHLTNGWPWLVLVVLFFMGAQSALFGPAKYGILPEMVRGRDLPRFNGMIQMTTFLALILGIPLAGFLLDYFGDSLWKAAVVCVVIAAVGTVTSFFVRRTPVAQADAKLQASSFAVAPDTRKVLREDPSLIGALVAYSVFWFVAAVVPLAVNSLGLNVLGLNAADTSMMLACISIGIAAGCLVAGKLSRGRVNFTLVKIGCWGLLLCLLAMSLPGSWAPFLVDKLGVPPEVIEWMSGYDSPHLLGYRGSQVALAIAGVFAGLFAVPVQVYLQARPPEAIKGRMIGTMNLINWIGIILSAGFYFLCQWGLAALGWPPFFTFGATAFFLLLIGLFYHPKSTDL